MTRRRAVTPDEKQLFEKAIDAPRPLKIAKSAKPVLSKPKKKTAKNTLDGHTAKKLLRGEIVPDGKIDLHGMTQDAAYGALLHYLRVAHKREARLVLVVTGKGKRPADDERFDMDRAAPGILKSLVPRWLAEPLFSLLIAGTATAHRRHGGEGALYVYLRK